MPRLDRFLTLYFFQPLLRLVGNREPRVPVLMYHSISELTSTPRHPYYEIRTSPAAFRAHMTILRDFGFTTLYPCEIAPWLKNAAPNAKAVCLTFDDSYEDFLISAFPILEEFGFKSTVYVPTGLVGTTGPNGLKLMTWSQIRELMRLGVNIGSHTVSHPEMKRLTEAEMRRELVDSKLSLEDTLGQLVQDFSHPFAFPEHNRSYVEAYRRNLQAAGYRTGMTTIIGTIGKGQQSLTICRLPANGFDDSRFFAAKLNSSYNWLHSAQVFSKAFHR